jgi:hypothetical protein
VSNEKPARMMMQKTALRSIRPKDVMTSLFSLLTLHRRKVLQGFGKRQQCLGLRRHPVEFSLEKLMRYRELLVLTKSFKNKCVISGQGLTENNLRKWKVWSDRCQHCIADNTCGFLIVTNGIKQTYTNRKCSRRRYT